MTEYDASTKHFDVQLVNVLYLNICHKDRKRAIRCAIKIYRVIWRCKMKTLIIRFCIKSIVKKDEKKEGSISRDVKRLPIQFSDTIPHTVL